MKEKIEEILKAVSKISVLDDTLPNKFPCVTWHFYNEYGILYGKGKATEEQVSCQVDIWYKKEQNNEAVRETIKNIKSAIVNELYFTHPIKNMTYEEDKKLHHIYFNFDVLLEE